MSLIKTPHITHIHERRKKPTRQEVDEFFAKIAKIDVSLITGRANIALSRGLGNKRPYDAKQLKRIGAMIGVGTYLQGARKEELAEAILNEIGRYNQLLSSMIEDERD